MTGVAAGAPPVKDLTAPDHALAAVCAPLVIALGTVNAGLLARGEGLPIFADQASDAEGCGKVDADVPVAGAVHAVGAVRPRSAPSVPVSGAGEVRVGCN